MTEIVDAWEVDPRNYIYAAEQEHSIYIERYFDLTMPGNASTKSTGVP
jgi:hypothetical protein